MAATDTFVVDEADIEPLRDDGDTASTRLTFQAEHLEQRVIRFAPGWCLASSAVINPYSTSDCTSL